MSGDSPNAFTNENVFDFKEGRSSPAPTTSKDQNLVTASVLVEPPKEKPSKDKEKEDDEDSPDFSSPTLNAEDKEQRRRSDAEKTLELNDPKYEGPGKGDMKEEQNLLNGLTSPYPRKEAEEADDDDSCIVNCIYYTMECCKCSIV